MTIIAGQKADEAQQSRLDDSLRALCDEMILIVRAALYNLRADDLAIELQEKFNRRKKDDSFCVLRTFVVFNAEQTSGLNRYRVGFAQPKRDTTEPYKRADAVFAARGNDKTDLISVDDPRLIDKLAAQCLHLLEYDA